MINPKLHTAEHILWQVLKNKLNLLKTRALQFNESYCRFDFVTDEELDEKDLREITEIVNGVIDENLEVIIETMPRENAKNIIDLSLVPETVDSVKVVKIGNFSIEACAGEHVKNTSEIGKFRIIEYKRIGKNTLRIRFTLDNL